MGKLVEGPICRELEQRYGVIVNRGAVSTHYAEADHGDMLLSFQRSPTHTGDIKGFRVHSEVTQPAEAAAKKIASLAYALVPVVQLNRPKDIYIFTSVVLDGRLDHSAGITGTGSPALLTYPRWASRTEVIEWGRYPQGTRVYPYRRTRVANQGETFCKLHTLVEMPQHLMGELSKA